MVVASLSVLAILFAGSALGVGSSYSFAATKQQTLSLTIDQGGITNAGPQSWTMSGGSLVEALDTATSVLSNALWSSVNYSMSAHINGLSASGTFRVHLSGITAAGQKINVRVHTMINESIPAVCFPSYTSGACATSDTSEIPAYFVAFGYVRIQTGNNFSPKYPIALEIEDAALNPFGGPIVIASTDGSLLIVATYSHADTVWNGVQTAGILSGTLGSTAVSGGFTQMIHTEENYVTGTASDHGQISLVQMTPATLDANGRFSGTSTIPTTGTVDCSPPGLPGTCTETGYTSTGTFKMDPAGLTVSGSYAVQWPAPSVVFGGNITAKTS
jgi:hypothetical protein